MKSERQIKRLAQKIRIKPDATVDERVLARAETALAKSTNNQDVVSLQHPSIWRTIMKSPITKIAAAAVIIIAVLAGTYYFGDSVNIAGTAYAEVVERLQNARTMTYIVESNTGLEWMPSMTMEIAFKEPGYMRFAMAGGSVSIVDSIQGKSLTIIPLKKQFIEFEMSNLQNDPAQKNINVIEKLRSLPERADEQLGTREIDGREVQGFRITEEGLIHTVWIDMQTRELVLVEMEFLNAPGMSGTMSDFRFDVELDDSLFNITPPDDYTRMEIQVDTDEVSEQNLIEFLRMWTTWVKDGRFPPTIDPTKLAKSSMEMVRNGQFINEGPISEKEQYEKSLKMTYGLMFLLKMPADSNWRYAGENVKFGDADTAIFWYRPQGSETYRVIYGDLSVKDIAPEDILVDKIDFEPVIPEEVTAIPTEGMKAPSMSEEAAVEGLKFFAEIIGQYPKNLNVMNLIEEFQVLKDSENLTDEGMKLQEEMGRMQKDERMKKAMEMIRPVQSLGMFYMMLEQGKKEPAYYGDTVTVQDAEKVLLRWKISDDQYRVIFGDLSTLDVSADELAELEKSSLK
ncbi:MAG: LolA family protein [Planctomycetota bacterium]|jgi:outer membrane lipoprotein-sorting protein